MQALNPYSDTVTGHPQNAAVKGFTVPVSGMVMLYGPEIAIVDTPEFQRLGGIKQLGTTYVVFRGARHTRFEHSIGTLHQAERMIGWLTRNPKEPVDVPPQARRLARLAALLHDLPHVPFGHTLEDELGLLERHDRNSSRIDALLFDSRVGGILRDSIGDDELALLREHLLAKGDDEFAALKYPYVADIVGNTLCSDLLDYAQRDLLACGMPLGLGDHFLSYLTVSDDDPKLGSHGNRLALMLDKKGMPRPDVESEVIKLLEARYELAERVYFHHAKNAASVMLGRAVMAAGLAYGPGDDRTDDARFRWLSDDTLLQLLETPELGALLDPPVERPIAMDPSLARGLATAIRCRQLYKVAFLAVADDIREQAEDLHSRYGTPEVRQRLEDEMARLTGAEPGEVLIHLPRPKMMVKSADVRVITSTGTVLKLSEWDKSHSRRIEALNEAHRRLWRLAVYVHPRVAANGDAMARIRARSEDVFQARSRTSPADGSRLIETIFTQYADEYRWPISAQRDVQVALAAHEDHQGLDDVVAAIDTRVRLLTDLDGAETDS